MEAGLEAVNLTESQFGISTSRDNFPWNLSGTYVQAMPYMFSRDARERTVRLHLPTLRVVFQVRHHDLVEDLLTYRRILQRHQCLDSMVEVTLHPIR